MKPWLLPVLALPLACSTANPATEPAANPATEPAAPPTPSAQPSTQLAAFEGMVAGAPFAPRSALFLWRHGADDMQLLFSDSTDLCAAVSAEAWPSGATVLSILLKLRDEPFGAGDYPVRAPGPRETKRATFLQLDGGCRPAGRSDASGGTVRLTTGTVSPDGPTEGEIDLTFADGSLKGAFTASFCAPPEMELHGCK